MKDNKGSAQTPQMTADSQARLLAYSAAASLGAFFAGQSAEGAVVQAPGLAPYPHVFLPPELGSTNATNFYLSIEGGSVTNFNLYITPDLTTHPTNKFPSQVIRMPGIVPDTNNPAVVNGQVLSALRGTFNATRGWTNSYCVAFLGGSVIGNNTNSVVPWTSPQLGISYNFSSAFPWVNYVNSSFQNGFPFQFLGFKFTSSADGQEHFGYMDVKVNFVRVTFDAVDPDGNPTTLTKRVCESVVINDCVYETTPEADILVPTRVKITNIDYQGGSVTIDFSSNAPDNFDASVFVVETSPTLGPSANWTTDPQANVFQLKAPGLNTSTVIPATYQAVTFADVGATAQYWRIRKL